MEGVLMNNDKKFIRFINEICNIPTLEYDNIYSLNDNNAGSLLLIKVAKYRIN